MHILPACFSEDHRVVFALQVPRCHEYVSNAPCDTCSTMLANFDAKLEDRTTSSSAFLTEAVVKVSDF
jgi:hypothetical protein